MEAVDVRGRFVWHELMTRDVPAAKTFYSKLTGWKTIPWPLDPTYTVCHADTGPVAGIMQIPAELPAATMQATPDIRACSILRAISSEGCGLPRLRFTTSILLAMQ